MRDPKPALQRRGVLAGVGAVGALAAVVTVLPKSPAVVSDASQALPQPDTAAGYRLTDHVKRYYASTRI